MTVRPTDRPTMIEDCRPVKIESIEFVGNGERVPILLGITGVVEW